MQSYATSKKYFLSCNKKATFFRGYYASAIKHSRS